MTRTTSHADTCPVTVAEPIAVKMLANGGNAWLSSQLFVGFMFLGAALCTLLLRSWKIDQIAEKDARERQDEDRGTTAWQHRTTLSHTLRVLRMSFVAKRV